MGSTTIPSPKPPGRAPEAHAGTGLLEGWPRRASRAIPGLPRARHIGRAGQL